VPAVGRWPRSIAADGASAAGWRGSYAPLFLGGRPLGLIAAYTPLAAAPLSEDALRLLDAFGAQAALAVGRAPLAAEEERARAAAESERLKSTFLASVSHDLRTPLTAIKASAGQLLAAAGVDTETAETAASIDREVDRLNRLVGNVLEMSRIEASALPPHTAPEDIAELIGVAVQRVAPLLHGRRVEVRIDETLPRASRMPRRSTGR
jgi:two-component system, OmpR family, sensor histidine kinase KdpD